jgi:heme A synthase
VSPTSVVKDPVSVLVTSELSPFPSEQETPKPVAPAPAPSALSTEAIGGIVGGILGFILIVVLVVLWVRSRKKVHVELPMIDGLMDRFSFPQ